MEIVYLLVPLSVGLALIILGVFAWASRSGQFDDLEREGMRILENDEPGEPRNAVQTRIDTDQA